MRSARSRLVLAQPISNTLFLLTRLGVMTYSELDAILKSLHADQGLKVWDRAVWFVKKDEVGQIIVRLQNHKSTFGLMLNIIQWYVY